MAYIGKLFPCLQVNNCMFLSICLKPWQVFLLALSKKAMHTSVCTAPRHYASCWSQFIAKRIENITTSKTNLFLYVLISRRLGSWYRRWGRRKSVRIQRWFPSISRRTSFWEQGCSHFLSIFESRTATAFVLYSSSNESTFFWTILIHLSSTWKHALRNTFLFSAGGLVGSRGEQDPSGRPHSAGGWQVE